MNVIENVVELATKNRAAAFACLLLMIIIGISYEIHTSKLEVERLFRISSLLTELEPLTNSKNEQVKKLAEQLVTESANILKQNDIDLKLPFDQRIVLALLLGGPWLVLSLTGFGEALNGEKDWFYGTAGCLFIGMVCASIGYVFPVEIHWFYRYILFPLGLTFITIFAFWRVGESDDAEESNA